MIELAFMMKLKCFPRRTQIRTNCVCVKAAESQVLLDIIILRLSTYVSKGPSLVLRTYVKSRGKKYTRHAKTPFTLYMFFFLLRKKQRHCKRGLDSVNELSLYMISEDRPKVFNSRVKGLLEGINVARPPDRQQQQTTQRAPFSRSSFVCCCSDSFEKAFCFSFLSPHIRLACVYIRRKELDRRIGNCIAAFRGRSKKKRRKADPLFTQHD